MSYLGLGFLFHHSSGFAEQRVQINPRMQRTQHEIKIDISLSPIFPMSMTNGPFIGPLNSTRTHTITNCHGTFCWDFIGYTRIEEEVLFVVNCVD